MKKGGWIVVLAVVGCGSDAAKQTWLLPELSSSQGLSVTTPEFDVPAGTEVQDCYFFAIPQAIDVDHIKLAINTGSHHMNIFRVKTIVNLDPAAGEPVKLGNLEGTVIRGADSAECWKAPNWADWPLVANSQSSGAAEQVIDWNLPQGVATHFDAGEMLMLQVHYVNSTDQVTPEAARGGVNFYRSQDGDTMQLGTVFAAQKQIRVCRSTPTPSYSGGCKLPAGVRTVAAANGHFHSRGKRFQMWGWDGVNAPTSPAFYESSDWAEPAMVTDLDVALPDAGGVMWTCDFQWSEPSVGCAALDAADPMQANDCCYVFGGKVESNEHCNAFVYYYPANPGDTVSCAPIAVTP